MHVRHTKREAQPAFCSVGFKLLDSQRYLSYQEATLYRMTISTPLTSFKRSLTTHKRKRPFRDVLPPR